MIVVGDEDSTGNQYAITYRDLLDAPNLDIIIELDIVPKRNVDALAATIGLQSRTASDGDTLAEVDMLLAP